MSIAPAMTNPDFHLSRAEPSETAPAARVAPVASPPAVVKRGRLETFRAPQPSAWLIKALAPVNRTLCLRGTPGLRDVPGLNKLPFVRGLADIRGHEISAEDVERLRAVVRPDCATFLTPNHPEFFTDWMLDKELLARVAPLSANWATHTVVNGLGPVAQAFWLKNNLIAQIPGEAGAAGRAHSIRWAVKGHGVLLHPEGQVGWHGDWVGPLFPGAVEMAAEAARALGVLGGQRAAYVAPIVWKLKFQRDVAGRLGREMEYVEQRLQLTPRPWHTPLGERLHAAYMTLLARDEAIWSGMATGGSYHARQARVLDVLRDRLVKALQTHGGETPAAPADLAQVLRAADRWLRTSERRHGYRDEVQRLVRDTRRLLRFRPSMYPHAELTQEQIAESLKRLRTDYCEGTLRDNASRFVPRPAGPRTAYVRVPQPIDMTALLKGRQTLEKDEIERAVKDLRARMQASLDAINADISRLPPGRGGFIREPNPFFEPGLVRAG